MNLQNIIFEREGAIAFITLNRPEVYNALNHEVYVELGQVMEEIRQDPGVRVIILTGAGEKAFVSGTDVNAITTLTTLSGWESSRFYQSVLDRLEGLGKPSIAAINGYCLGGGLELAMACTLRISSNKGRFGLPELGLGFVPGIGGTQRLMRLVGKGKGAELLLTAKTIDAQEAFRIGLVNEVVSAAELIPKAKEMAGLIINNGPTATTLAMHLILRGPEMTLDNALVFESALSAISFGSPDAAQRTKAFLERKKQSGSTETK
jgi:enoyl-CoA hydratase